MFTFCGVLMKSYHTPFFIVVTFIKLYPVPLSQPHTVTFSTVNHAPFSNLSIRLGVINYLIQQRNEIIRASFWSDFFKSFDSATTTAL